MSNTVTVTVTGMGMGVGMGTGAGKRWALSLLFLMTAATSAAAQVAGSGTRCAEKDAVGSLGISGIDCDCTISPRGSGKAWHFRSEPKITSLEMDTRGGRLLKIGDVITHVNGKSVRTSEGARELAEIDAAEAVILSVRRSGRTMQIAITADAVCANEAHALGIYAPGRAHGTAPRTGVYRATPTPPSGSTPRATQPPSVYSYTPHPDRPGHAAIAATRYAPRASFGMGLSCSGNCSIHIDTNDKTKKVVMSFSEPPEVYSIERGGPAEKAGIRRGDVLTHINDKPMDSDKGGEHFANVKPGETVRFTIRRGKERKTVSVKAQEISPGTPQPELAQTYRGLMESREALTELTREQAEQVRRMQSDVRRSQQAEESKLKEAYRELIKQEQEHHKKLIDLSSHLAKIDSKMRVALADSARICEIPSMLAPSASTRSTRTLRYSGTMADTEIEVRGSNPVSVNETNEEVVITTGGTVVRVSKKK